MEKFKQWLASWFCLVVGHQLHADKFDYVKVGEPPMVHSWQCLKCGAKWEES